MQYLVKKSLAEIPAATGVVSDTVNVTDEITNAPSIRLVKELALGGIPNGTILAYNGTEVPEGYELVSAPLCPTKVTELYKATDYTAATSWQKLDLSDSLDNYDALLTEFFYYHESYTEGIPQLSSSFNFYTPNTPIFIEKTMGNWNAANTLNIQTLIISLYQTEFCTSSQVRIQHCDSMNIVNSEASKVGGRKMGVSRIIGYKF